MALQDFIKKLEEQEDTDTVYSKQPESVIRIIPPQSTGTDKQSISMKDSTRIIPPQHEPVMIKFTNLNIRKSSDTVKQKGDTSPTQPRKSHQSESTFRKPAPEVKSSGATSKPVETKPKEQVPTQPAVSEKDMEEALIEKLFLQSETPLEKKALWIENYKGANASKKNSELVDKVKRGRFRIDENNKIMLLSEYITSEKSVQSILNDKWI